MQQTFNTIVIFYPIDPFLLQTKNKLTFVLFKVTFLTCRGGKILGQEKFNLVFEHFYSSLLADSSIDCAWDRRSFDAVNVDDQKQFESF